jgi:hypothetical protein
VCVCVGGVVGKVIGDFTLGSSLSKYIPHATAFIVSIIIIIVIIFIILL